MKLIQILFWGLLFAATVCRGQDNQAPALDEGWFSKTALTNSGYGSAPYGPLQNSPMPGGTSALAEAVTPEITALARGLENDPKRIFDYVHDHIRYVHYFGSHKGAELTLLERSGNAFDQCALLVALLRQAGMNPAYEFGVVSFPYASSDDADYQHWVGVTDSDPSTTTNFLGQVNWLRGFPFTLWTNGSPNFHHVWVKVAVGGTNYLLDPSFKVSEPVVGIDLDTAMGLSASNLLASAGGTNTADYVQGMSEANVRGTLTGYTSNLLSALQSGYPNASVEEIAGGKRIVSSATQPLGQPLAFTVQTNGGAWPVSEWQYIPTNLMGVLSVGLADPMHGVTNVFYIPSLGGDRLSLTFSSNGLAQLWQQDNQIFSAQTTGNSSNVTVTLGIQHPYGTWNFTNNALVRSNAWDQAMPKDYRRTNATYVLLYAFDAAPAWLTRRQQELDAYRVANADSSPQVQKETLNVMGLSWLVQTELAGELVAGQEGVLMHSHHRLGRMGQETGRGYFVDIYEQLDSSFGAGGPYADQIRNASQVFQAGTYLGSALEHAMIEQLQSSNLVGASTIKILELAATNSQRIYLANNGNWTSGASVSTHLSGYDVNSLYANYISNGYSLLIPSNGVVQIAGAGSWSGSGYAALLVQPGSQKMKMIIQPGYQGGYVSDLSAFPNAPYVWQTSYSQPDAFDPQSVFLPQTHGADPVNLADASFVVDETDLSLGQTEPRGLSFTRHYSPARRHHNLAGMAYAWTHNYDCAVGEVSAPEPGLGMTTPQQMAPMLVGARALLQVYDSSQADPKNWMVTALIAKWAADQLIKNGVSVGLGADTIQFIKQPDGRLTPPANCTMTLSKTGGSYALQERHGRTFNFGTNGLLSSIADQYTNVTLSLSYSNNLVSRVTDWKSRWFNFTYSGSPLHLDQVSDSTGRTVSYGYTVANGQTNLTSVTDPQQKAHSFAWDTNHQIVAVSNALSQLVVSNVYNSFGQVTTQYTQGASNKMWLIYWSGWETVEQDPAGNKRRIFYDDKAREIGRQDALGNLSQRFYDGQDHVVMTISPLNETNQTLFDGYQNVTATIDPLGYSNQFLYDTVFNLITATDQNGHASHFGYNTHFQLTGVTNAAGEWFTNGYSSTDGTLTSHGDSAGTTTNGTDAYGFINLIRYPNGLGSESFINNALGDVLVHVNARGFGFTNAYNLRRELTNTLGPSNFVWSVVVDAVGNAVTNIDARGFPTAHLWSPTRKPLASIYPSTPQGTASATNVYDSRDWLFQTIANPGSSIAAATTFSNNAAGWKVAVTDPLLRPTTFAHDPDGRATGATNAEQQATTLQLDARGEALVSADPALNTVKRAFDGAGNNRFLTNRNQKIWQFQFSAASELTNTITPLNHQSWTIRNDRGLVAAARSPAGNWSSNFFDGLKRVTNHTDYAGTILYGLDANGNVTNVSGVNPVLAAVSFTFDGYDRVLTYRDADGNLVQYGYDANGDLTLLVYPGNRAVHFYYNALNLLTNVTDWLGGQTFFEYDLAGRPTKLTRPNATMRLIGYDLAGETTNIIEKTGANLPIAFFKLGFTNSGRIAWEFTAPLPYAYAPPTRTMVFDDDNRLATNNGVVVISDDDGNMTSGPLTNDTPASYSYNARDWLVAAGSLTYGYDALGNRTSITNGTNVSRFVINPGAALPQVLMRIKPGTTNYYIYGLGLLYEITETATSTNMLTYHSDYRGSTIAITDKYGNVTDRIEYSAYGTITFRTNSGVATDTPFLYNGRYGVMSDANGLLYMRARYYNPYICRFINADPSGFSGGLNFYAFAAGNPVSNLDPFGLGAIGESEAPSWISRALGNDPLGDWSRGFGTGFTSWWNGEDPNRYERFQSDDYESGFSSGYSAVPTAVTLVSLALAIPTDGWSLEVESLVGAERLIAATGEVLQAPESWTMRYLLNGSDVLVPQGTSGIRNLMANITADSGNEVALLRLTDGTRVLRMGGPDYVTLGQDVETVLAHTHPSGSFNFSTADIMALWKRDQLSSVLISPSTGVGRRVSVSGNW